MTRHKLHAERHMVSRIGWLRAAVLGANDGIISTASLIVGVAAASASSESVFLTGVAGLVAGSMSMAAGEYVSVCSQSDSETADIARETKELADDPQGELNELTGIYLSRGLDPELANQVARQLMARDPLAAHMRDELHLTEATKAKPVQAALTSALTFAIGAAMPLMVLLLTPLTQTVVSITVATLALLALLGAIGAHAGGAPIGKAMIRVTLWGAVAMAITAGIGKLFGAAI